MLYLMRYYSLLLLLVLSCPCLAGTAKVGVIRGFSVPPYGWLDPSTNKIHGLNSRLMRLVSRDCGLEIEYVFYDKSQLKDSSPLMTDLKQGKIDIHVMTLAASKGLDFVHVIDHPISTVESRIFTHADRPFTFNQWSDLKGRKGVHRLISGGMIGGTQAFDGYARNELDIRLMESTEQMIQEVTNGSADYFISIYRPMLLKLRLRNHVDSISALDHSVHEVPLHWVISKQSLLMECKEQIEALLLQYNKEGRTEFILQEEMRRFIQMQKELRRSNNGDS